MFRKIMLALIFVCASAMAMAASTQPIKIITFLPAGSAPDSALRKIAEQLSVKRNQPVIVDNRPGGGGLVALQVFLNEPKNSLTLFQGDIASVAVSPTLNEVQIPTDELEPLLGFLRANEFLIVNPKIKDLNDLKELIKNKPSYGSWGVGSVPHLLGLEFSEQLGINTTHVPYKEWNQWYIDLSNGELGFSFSSFPSTNKFTKTGKLRYLAVAAPTRDPAFPDVPTIQELTGKKIDSLQPWATIFSRVTLGAEFNQQLAKDIVESYKSVEVQESISAMGFNPAEFLYGDNLNKFLKSEWALNKNLLTKFNIKIK